jgi:hypothetical protein
VVWLLARSIALAQPWILMATIVEIAAAIDAFLATPKLIVGHDMAPQWGPGYVPQERVAKYPLEIAGEQRGAQLMVVGFPRERDLKFRVGILFSGMICRLDYTGETHPNSLTGVLRGLPLTVTGPHYHSWPLNRRFCRGIVAPARLHDAVPYEEHGRSFDAILRWFCTDTNIEPLPPDHRMGLPARETLI